MRALIVNADDYGFTDEVNRGITEAHAKGIVTSASMMVRQPGWRDAVRYATSNYGDLDVGLHFNVSVGTPCTKAKSLTNARTGAFLPVPVLVARALARRVRAEEVFAECLAQAADLQDNGLAVSHIDGHQHLHLLPGIWEGVVAAATALGNVPVRFPREHEQLRPIRGARWQRDAVDAAATWAMRRQAPLNAPHHFAGSSQYGDGRYAVRLRSLLAVLPEGTTELITHPGYRSRELPGDDPYNEQREVELQVLLSDEFRAALEQEHIALRSFRPDVALASV
jgi:predicted glycoside hydrolase/deacetylase ChbG (UPF0249 family)